MLQNFFAKFLGGVFARNPAIVCGKLGATHRRVKIFLQGGGIYPCPRYFADICRLRVPISNDNANSGDLSATEPAQLF